MMIEPMPLGHSIAGYPVFHINHHLLKVSEFAFAMDGG